MAGPMAVTTTLRSMRTALTILAIGAVIGATSACSSSAGSDEVAARDREKQVVDAVTEAVPLAEQALGATQVKVGGGWSSCPGGVGHVYSGGGTITAPEGDTDAQLDAVRTALTEAGFEEGTLVEGHVSVSRDEVGLDFAPSAARGPGAWAVSFTGPCKRYGGDDEQYVRDQNLEGERTLLP